MIWDSSPWREILDADGKWLNSICASDTLSEKQLCDIEQKIFLSAYSIRKLIEAKKIPDFISNKKCPLLKAARHDSVIHHYNWHHIEKHYDVFNASLEQRPLTFLLNQIIHSHVFIYVEGLQEEAGFWVVSKQKLDQGLTFCRLVDWCNVMFGISEAHVVDSHYKRDPDTGEERFILE